MSALALTLPRRSVRRLRVLGFTKDLFAGLFDGLHMMRRYNALTALSDVELAQKGLKRQDIARLVATGVSV